jgi:hypothetical protein
MASFRGTTASSSSTRRARASFADRARQFDFARQCFGTRFQFSQLAFEGEQSGAFFEIACVAGVDELAAGDPVAIQGDVHLAGRDRLDHRVFEIRGESRIHLLRQTCV